MVDKYLRHLTKQIDDKVVLLREALGNGSARDFAEYKTMVGEIKGLLTAQMNAQDLLDKLEEIND